MPLDPPDDELRIMVRAKIALGTLPRDGAIQFQPGFGDGQVCTACGVIIAPRTAMYDSDRGSHGRVYLHRPCYDMWIEEMRA